MRGWFILVLMLCSPGPAEARHQRWAGIDLCQAHEQTMPPGLSRDLLPEPESPGAMLLAHYCTQCHNLPGPDRLAAKEWRKTLDRMFLLMDVTQGFGGLMGKMETLPQRDRPTLLAYLQRAATPADPRTDGAGTSFQSGRLLWILGPVFFAVGMALLKRRRSVRGRHRSCVIS